MGKLWLRVRSDVNRQRTAGVELHAIYDTSSDSKSNSYCSGIYRNTFNGIGIAPQGTGFRQMRPYYENTLDEQNKEQFREE